MDCIVIGAGHAGLAVSYCLAQQAIDHVIIERGQIGNSWRTERWDSLTLLTPNWQSRLPGYCYQCDDPDGYMKVSEVVAFLEDYAQQFAPPLLKNTTVTEIVKHHQGFRVTSDQEQWLCRALVLATGACNKPAIPNIARRLPDTVRQIAPIHYKNPDQLPAGGVLVVGASATGLQLAEEIQRSGRQVTLAVGEHVRLPRSYRGRDIQWWMDAAGILDQGLDQIDDVNRARNLPSPQLIGSKTCQLHDLNRMTQLGVTLVGRLMEVRDTTLLFSGSLANVCALADLKMDRLLKALDEWAQSNIPSAVLPPPQRFAPTHIAQSPPLRLEMAAAGIKTVLWATGFRPDYSWLDMPVLDRKGNVRHTGGVADLPGLYIVGMPFLRKRKSSFIHGIEDDARYICTHLAAFLGQR